MLKQYLYEFLAWPLKYEGVYNMWIMLIIGVILIIVLFGVLIWQNGAGKRLIDKADLIKPGMTKEEVFEILEYREPREVTKNVAKGTERYRWSAGQNTYTRSYIRGTGISTGSSSHNRRHLTVVFKDNKVIEISTK